MINVYPSILNINEDQFDSVFNILNKHESFKRVHLDVMDGKYVDNISFSPSTISLIKKYTDREIDVHLMTYNLFKNIYDYIDEGARSITFHKDAIEDNDVYDVINLIKFKNVLAGLAINPSDSIEDYYKYLKDIDIVLLMSVVPGKGGQEFIEDSLERIKKLYQYKIDNNLQYEIIVDGGINDFIANKCLICGADSFVVGSYLMKNLDNIKNFD